MKKRISIGFLIFLFQTLLFANASLSIPDALTPWKGWVLKGHEELLCPVPYNVASPHFCVWPTSLSLSLDETSGQFEQKVVTYLEGFVALPGEKDYFPTNIKVNGNPFPVIAVNNIPSVYLVPGNYTITGEFTWNKAPESLLLPKAIGTLALKSKGVEILQPDRDIAGRVWVNRQERILQSPKEVDSLSLKVFRLIDDSIPQTDLTLIRLMVSGKNREVNIGPVLQNEAALMMLQSPLPAQLSDQGLLRIQVRPGQWEIYVKSRFLKPISELTNTQHAPPWPKEEIWSFEARNDLRLVDIKGGISLDPKQTDLPQQWWSFPAYLMKENSSLHLVEKRRGQVKRQGEDLALRRQLWLDFSGKGYTVVDNLIGRIEQHWRLTQLSPYQLGRVTLDGQDKLITQITKGGPSGIEIRQGQIDLTSVSRVLERTFKLPAVSWNIDVKSLSATLYLPPGWLLLGTWGADTSSAWIQKWNLLDLFLILVITASVFKLLGIRYAVVALIALGLTYHEPGTPIWLWLNVIAAFALLRVLHVGGWGQRWVRYYFNASFVVLIVMAVPFMIQQARNALYPQLSVTEAPASLPITRFLGGEAKEMMAQENVVRAMDSMARAPIRQMKPFVKKKMFEMNEVKGVSSVLDEYDPSEKIQTGPSIPQWMWNAHELSWNGPVLETQQLKLWLVPRSINSFLKLLEIFLMAVLAYGLARPFGSSTSRMKPPTKIVSLGAILLLQVGLVSSLLPSSAFADYPNQALLNDLRSRLVEPPSCLPNCADVNRMQIQINPTQLTLTMSFQLAANVAVPLPSQLGKWMPRTVLVDNVVAKNLLVGEDGQLWLQASEGVHEITLEGPIGDRSKFDVTVPLTPKQVNVIQDGWQVEGIFNQKLQGNAINFTRTKALLDKNQPTQNERFEPSHIPSFSLLQRTFHLGIDWEVVTVIRRLAPLDGPISVSFPLLQGESVLSDNVEVKDKKVFAQLSSNQNELAFKSKLSITPTLSLVALNNPNVKEIWQLDAMSRWYCKFDGIPMIQQKDQQQHWLPTWQPWPNEKLTITVMRPFPVEGNTLTIDNSRLLAIPGKEASRYELSFTARTSQGTQYTFGIPEDAEIQDVQVNGVSQPITLKQGRLTLPLDPGTQEVLVKWQTLKGLSIFYRTPRINLEQSNSNAILQVEFSKKDRWILLLGGPAVGPAILFWGVLIVILLLAWALGHGGYTPLRTWEWLLLAMGITLAKPIAGIFIVLWFIAMEKRKTVVPTKGVQIGLVVLTLVFIVSLFTSISEGLLDIPAMQLKQPLSLLFDHLPYSSNKYMLQWYQDISPQQLPIAWVLSVPLAIYRTLMLLWALWLAFSLVKWLRWGWICFATKGYWHSRLTAE